MRWALRSSWCVGLLVVGYGLGLQQGNAPLSVRADQNADPPSGAVRDRLREANRLLAEVMQLLQEEKRYVPAIQGLNAFATSVGGVDAVADLESGQGVDPETFAGLYAGNALPEIAENLSRDPEGRMTYKHKIVRMCNSTRLKQMFASRGEFSPVAGSNAKRSAAVPKKDAEPDAEKKTE